MSIAERSLQGTAMAMTITDTMITDMMTIITSFTQKTAGSHQVTLVLYRTSLPGR